jgi:hypothetical protein
MEFSPAIFFAEERLRRSRFRESPIDGRARYSMPIAWLAVGAVIFGSHFSNPAKTTHLAGMPRKWAFPPDSKAGMCPKAVNSSQGRVSSRVRPVARGPSAIAERPNNTLNRLKKIRQRRFKFRQRREQGGTENLRVFYATLD